MMLEACDGSWLDLAVYPLHSWIAAFVPSTGRFGFFIGDLGRECFVEPHQLPPLALAAVASAADLPDAHDLVAFLSRPDCVDFDEAREAIISKLKAKTLSEGVTSGMCVQLRIS
jgi:hypothetical protein